LETGIFNLGNSYVNREGKGRFKTERIAYRIVIKYLNGLCHMLNRSVSCCNIHKSFQYAVMKRQPIRSIKGTVQRTRFFELTIDSETAQGPPTPCNVFSILPSYLRRYWYSKIDSPVSFTTESRCSAYCLLRRVETPRVVYFSELSEITFFFNKSMTDL